MTVEGAAAPGEPVIEIEAWEAATGTARLIPLPSAGEVPGGTVTVQVPPGVVDGAVLRLEGAVPPAEPGLPAGDLLVRVQVRPPVAPASPESGAPGYPPAFPVSGAPGYPPAGMYPPPGVMPPPARRAGSRLVLVMGAAAAAVLLVCAVGFLAFRAGGTSRRAGAGTGGSAAAASPSPVPVSTDAYRHDLAALDAAVAPGFAQLRGAHTPTAVTQAITTISDGLASQIAALRLIEPPVAVRDAHAIFLDALSTLASDVQGAGASAGSQELCGGSSALSTIGRSPGATQTRTAVKQLAAAAAAQPYRVGAWLPTASPPQTRRTANGTYIKAPTRGGLGKLKITNGGAADAAITLAPAAGGKAVITVYVRAKGTFTAGRIADGAYAIFVTTGSDWDSGAHAFTRDCDYSKFDSTAAFRTTATTYTQYSISLTPVAGGDTTTSGVDPDSFPS